MFPKCYYIIMLVNIQTKVEKNIKTKAEEQAQSLGFNSVQDAIRVFLVGLANRTYKVDITQRMSEAEIKYLTKLAKEAKNYKRQIAKGDYSGIHVFNNTQEFLDTMELDEEDK
jgi:antitoxin component of RelBE/YafQ-DinJ toxin-antitoxin module